MMEEYLSIKCEICMYVYEYYRYGIYVYAYISPSVAPCMSFRLYIDSMCM